MDRSDDVRFTVERAEGVGLLAVGVAGAVSVAVAEGEWDVMSIAIGLTLLAVMLAFDRGRRDNKRVEAAYAAVYGVVGMIIVAGFWQPPVDEGHPPVDEGHPPVDEGQPPVDEGQPPVDEGQAWEELAFWVVSAVVAAGAARFTKRKGRLPSSA